MLKSFKALALAVTATLALAGCKEIKIEDGRVPAGFASVAQKYAGAYKGSFNGQPAQIEVILAAGDRVVLTYQDAQGYDVLQEGCNSSIGRLLGVNVKEKNGAHYLKKARFAFNPGSCKIDGKELLFAVKEKSGQISVELKVVETATVRTVCDSATEGGRHCRPVWTYTYIEGQFTK